MSCAVDVYKGKTILIVDDDPVFSAVLAEVLGGLGVGEILLASGRHQAEQMVKTASIDCVLCDCWLVGSSGVDFVSWLKSQKNYKKIPVVMISGLPEQSTIVEAFNVGTVDFLVKPFSSERLALALEEVLGSSRGEGEGSQLLTQWGVAY